MRLINRTKKRQEWVKRWVMGNIGERSITVPREVFFELLQIDSDEIDIELIASRLQDLSWRVTNTCYQCGNDVEVVVEIGEEPERDSQTTWVCLSCIKSAHEDLITAYADTNLERGE